MQGTGYWEGDKLCTKAFVKGEDHITYREVVGDELINVSVERTINKFDLTVTSIECVWWTIYFHRTRVGVHFFT